MDYEFMHAAFPSRVDAGRSLAGKGKGKQKLAIGADQVSSVSQPGEISCVELTISHSLSPNPLHAHHFPRALAHEKPLPTLHHADHLAESTNRSQGWTSHHSRRAEKGSDSSAYFKSSSTFLFIDDVRRLLATATVNLARRQMHQPRAYRRKSQEFVPASHDRLIMSSHDHEGIHL